jgi:hypothetical protein
VVITQRLIRKYKIVLHVHYIIYFMCLQSVVQRTGMEEPYRGHASDIGIEKVSSYQYNLKIPSSAQVVRRGQTFGEAKTIGWVR